MKATKVIPSVLIGLGALTAYSLYVSTQKRANAPKDTIATLIQETEKQSVEKPKNTDESKLAGLKQDSKNIEPEKKAPVKTYTNPDFVSAFKPLFAKKYNKDELTHFVKAYELLRKGHFSKAKASIKKISDPLMRKCLKWYRYRKNPSSIPNKELIEFWTKNQDWPKLETMKAAVEANILGGNVREMRAYLTKHKPVSNAGHLAEAIVFMKDGEIKEAITMVRNIWRTGKLSKSLDKIILKYFGKHLTKEDRHIRAQRYLYEGRSKYVSAALRLASDLDKATRQILDAHIALIKRSRSAPKKVLALSEKDRLTPHVIYARAERFRLKKKYKEAWNLVLAAPSDPDKLVSPKSWWKIKRKLILEALNQKEFDIAYRLAKEHGQVSVNQLIDAEFMAGWISLRYLKKAKIGYNHFIELNKAADGPRSRSRSHYWLGRAALAMGEKVKAKQHFKDGAKYFNTFYGQLSRQSLNPNDRHIKIAKPDTPTTEDIKRFQNRDAVRVIMLAEQSGQHYLAVRFFHALRYAVTEPGERTLLAELAKQIGHTQQSVRIGKTAMFFGHNAAEYAYPIHAMPDFEPLGKMPEKAFSFAIARQESEFNTKIKSRVGARGVMQVMPATARILARRYKIKYSKQKLSNDPSYNVRFGAIYITERLEASSGSYIKSIAGYNAGPGRVRQWTKKFGDPSSRNVDPIDWIERIPFSETRNYVKKVLANMQIYRARLGKPKNALQLRKDLYRSRADYREANRPIFASK